MTKISGPKSGLTPRLDPNRGAGKASDPSKISQPHSTFGGKAAEPDSFERARVSSPLRSRSRALTNMRPEAFQKALDQGFEKGARNRLEGLLAKFGGIEGESTRPAIDKVLIGLSRALQTGLEQAGVPTGQSQALAANALPAVQQTALQSLPEGFAQLLAAIDQGPLAALHHSAATLGQKAPETAAQIAADPIGFARNLFGAVEAGMTQFTGNVAQHVVGDTVGWLADNLDQAGVHLPKSFDLKSMTKMALEVLGLTAEKALDLADQKFPGATSTAESLFDGLHNVPDVGQELLGRVVDKTRDLAGRLSPVGAIVESVKAIYNVTSFFIDRLRDVLGAVNEVAGAAQGIAGKGAQQVDGALQKLLPVAIGFLSEQIGLGGLSDKVRGVIGKVQEPVNKAVEWGISKGLEGARLTSGFLLGQVGDMAQNALSSPTENVEGYLGALREVGVGLARLAEHGAGDLVQTGLATLRDAVADGGQALDTARAAIAERTLEAPTGPESAPPGSAEIVAEQLDRAVEGAKAAMAAKNDAVDAVLKMLNAMSSAQQRVMKATTSR